MKVIILAGTCLLLAIASFAIGAWRNNHDNPVTRRLAKGWPGKMRLFAFIGLLLIVARVEEIQFLAMRILWVAWGLSLLLYAAFQAWWFRKNHYTLIRQRREESIIDKYLP